MTTEERKNAIKELEEIYDAQRDMISQLAKFRQAHPILHKLDIGLVAVADMTEKAHAWLAEYMHAAEEKLGGIYCDTVDDLISGSKSNGGGVATNSTSSFYDEISQGCDASLVDHIDNAIAAYNNMKKNDIMNAAARIVAQWKDQETDDDA